MFNRITVTPTGFCFNYAVSNAFVAEQRAMKYNIKSSMHSNNAKFTNAGYKLTGNKFSVTNSIKNLTSVIRIEFYVEVMKTKDVNAIYKDFQSIYNHIRWNCLYSLISQ